MSDEKPAEAKTKKKGGKGKLILLVGVALIVGGAGAAGGLYAAGAFSHEETGPKEDPNKPVLVLKGETAEAVAAAHGAPSGDGGGGEGGGHGGGGGGGEGHASGSFHLPPGGVDLPTPKNPANYQATYFQIPAPFTTNLADTDSFAQIAIAIGTYYDARIIQAMQMHETAIRSAILMMLAQEQEIDLSTPRGKEELQGKLKKTINTILKQKTGYGGVDNVYFTNFVIQ